MPQIILAHPPRDREELWWVVRALFGVKIPRTRVCPDHCAPFDAFADAYFGVCTIGEGDPYRISRAIWHASRGLAGKSKSLSILGLTFAYLLGADITILGGSMAQSANVHEYMNQGMQSENLPPDMTLDQTATKTTLTNKGRVRPLPASQKNVRGPHPSIMLIDEVDEMELDIYDAALGQPMPQPNYLNQTLDTMTVVASTWQNADGTFTEIFKRNEEKERPDPVYRWCYKETANPVDGWLTDQTIQDKKDDISEEMFRVEYDLGEPSIGNRAIDTDLLDAVYCLDDLPIEKKESKDFWEYRFARYEKGGVYVVGADWAKEKDYTVIRVARVDGPKRRIVYWLRVNRRPYPVMIGYFNKALRYYRVGRNGAWHDSTGLGNVVNDYLDVRARAFSMTGDKRVTLLSTYINALEKGTWQLPKFLRRDYSEHKYCRVGDLYSSAKEYHLPDTLAAGALAEHAARKVVVSAAPEAVKRDPTPTRHERQFVHHEEPEREAISPPAPERAISFVVGASS